jgi:RNA polymerase sigma factor (sigma-70 family)
MRSEADRTLAELEQVYRARFKAFLRCAIAYLGDAEAALDAVQEGVATAIRNRRSYRGEGTVEAWLWAIVINVIRGHYRERARMPSFAELGDDEGTPFAPSAEAVAAERVRAAVRRLPERQRLVLFLRFYADLDYATIARLLELSEGTVASSLHAARSALRGLLEEVRA